MWLINIDQECMLSYIVSFSTPRECSPGRSETILSSAWSRSIFLSFSVNYEITSEVHHKLWNHHLCCCLSFLQLQWQYHHLGIRIIRSTQYLSSEHDCLGSGIAAQVFRALAKTEESFFGSIGVEIGADLFSAPIRAQITRCILPEETGKVVFMICYWINNDVPGVCNAGLSGEYCSNPVHSHLHQRVQCHLRSGKVVFMICLLDN